MKNLGRCIGLSEKILEERSRRGWSQELLAERATDALQRLSLEGQLDSHDVALVEKSGFEVTRRAIQILEAFPKQPLGNAGSRLRLLGVTVAMDLDRNEINQLAGAL